jgi:DNA-binding CsgD family transcriptional regulator
MDHVVILGHLVILLVGTWALFLVHQTHQRFRLPFLKYFVYYVVIFNVAVFVYLSLNYMRVNVLSEDLTATDRPVLLLFFPVLLVVEVGLTFTLVQVLARLQGFDNLKVVNRAFVLAAILFTASYFAGLVYYRTAGSIEWLVGTTGLLVVLVMTTILGSLFATAVRKNPDLDPARRKAVGAFAVMMLLGYLPYVGFGLLREPYDVYGSVVNQLWLNFVPILWIHYFFLPYYARLSTSDENAVLDNIVREHNISKREREIMALIVEGKSNREIEEQLFISVNTVKNHIYHLYQKLGIKSRSQLMHLVLRNNHIESDH